MTVTDVPVDRLDALDAKIDLLSEQLTVLTLDAERRRRQRESFEDLAADLGRVSHDAMSMASDELQHLSERADLADTVRLFRHLIESAPTLDRLLVALRAIADLVDDAAPLGRDVMAIATDRLAEAERAGWFGFAGAAWDVADRVVTEFDEHDVELLGDNIVAMLEALRRITQPEMLVFVGRMVDAVQAEQSAVELEDAEPPSLWALARQIGDPEVRRGIGRALHTLRAVSAETGPTSTTSTGDST